MSRKVPASVKRRRHLVRLLEGASSHGAVDHYMRLLARMMVGYDPSRETSSPRRG
jgi:hypothetical protein